MESSILQSCAQFITESAVEPPPVSQPSGRVLPQPLDPEAARRARDAKFLARLMALDTKRGKRADTEIQKENKTIGRGATSPEMPEAEIDHQATNEARVIIPGPGLLEKLTTGNGAIFAEIALSIVILVALGFIGRAVAPLFVSIGDQASAIDSQPKQQAQFSNPPTEAVHSIRSGVQRMQPHLNGATFHGSVPAKIVWQAQPAFPSWAKKLDIDDVVTLDAVIDGKGSVKQTRMLSGPRALQNAARQAVGLWTFEPALVYGKPVPSHIVLTVEFQR